MGRRHGRERIGRAARFDVFDTSGDGGGVVNAAILIVEIVGIAAMVGIHRHQLRGLSSFFEERLRAQDEAEEGRRVALYKQQKASQQAVARSDRAVRKMVDQTRQVQADAAHALKRVDRLASDVKEADRG